MKFIQKARSWLRDRLTDDGLEKLDPTPVEIPLEFDRPLSLEERIARMMHRQHRQMQYLRNEEMETPEEADDFDIEDDPIDETTPYEEHFFAQPDVVPPVDSPLPEIQAAPAEPAPAGAGAEPAPEPEPEPAPAPVVKTRARKTTGS